ncbi:hypothetical protein GCM10010149_89060 [Nonomuraea roseoviolacea subsp. roseoviolacea]|uniref:toprim domain-containing protein n=1 Tax=Nonomuraea roseoviolacea TaxID=103837 RepID=UPI0031DB0208
MAGDRRRPSGKRSPGGPRRTGWRGVDTYINVVPGDVVEAMEDMGLDVLRVDESGEAQCRCPAHYELLGREDRHPSFSVNIDSGLMACFAGETPVITIDGVRAIKDLSGSEPVLLTSQGWVTAPVRSFGFQKLWDVVVRRNGVRKTIRATAEHRWFIKVSTGRKDAYWVERTTDQLKPNHQLKSVRQPRSWTLKPSPWGIAHGIVFGDGTAPRASGHHNVPARVNLYGEKDATLLKYFPLSPTNVVDVPDGVSAICVQSLPRYFKQFPPKDESAGYLYGWLAGYFAADGSVTKTGLPLISSSSREHLEYVRDVCLRIGVLTHGIAMQMRKGKGSEETPLYTLTFSRSALTEEFFLIDAHRERWLANKTVSERLGWVVESVTPTDNVEEVYCAQVPETHDFALEGNILTGNCWSCGFKGTFADLVAYVLKVDRADAVAWIRAKGTIRRVERILAKKPAVVDTSTQVNEASLALMEPPPPWALNDRGVTAEACARYGVVWEPTDELWITPVRDATGRLVGWQEKNKRYFRNQPEGLKKSQYLFGLQTLPEQCDVIVLVESPLDAVVLESAGIRYAVASYGASVSDAQLSLIAERTDHLILFLDNDGPGRKSRDMIIQRWSGRGLAISTVDYRTLGWGAEEEEGLDPGALLNPHLLRLVERAVPASIAALTLR